MVLAINAETTPSARVAPNVLSGGSGENELDMNAKTVVTTASIKATLIESNDWTHASAADLEDERAFSYPL